MSTQSVMNKVRSYLSSTAGMQAISKSAATGSTGAQIKQAAEDLRSMIEDSIPDSIRSTVVVSATTSFNTDCTANISIDIGGNLFRPSLEPHKYGGADNIVGLFSKGWAYPKWAAPSGYWHGQFTYARTKKAADPFINNAVTQWTGKYSGTLDIKSVNVNSAYT